MRDLVQNVPDPFSSQGPGMLGINQPLFFLWAPQMEQLLLFSAVQRAPGMHSTHIVAAYFFYLQNESPTQCMPSLKPEVHTVSTNTLKQKYICVYML